MTPPFLGRRSSWSWALLAPVVLAALGIGLGLLGMGGWFILSKLIASSSVYRAATDRAELVANHSTRLGPNSGAGDLIVGWVSPRAANFRVRHYGPKATSELRVRAHRDEGRWVFDQLDLVWRETNRVEDLRTSEERVRPGG